MIRKMICIECPKGCALTVDIENYIVRNVDGGKCPRGVVYAIAEVQDPHRIFTGTVMAIGLDIKLVPVRTDKPIPKRDIFRAAEEVRKMKIEAPLEAGDTVSEDFLGLGVKLLATREVVRRGAS